MREVHSRMGKKRGRKGGKGGILIASDIGDHMPTLTLETLHCWIDTEVWYS